MATPRTTSTKTTTRTVTESFELCTYQDGQTEVYTIDATGLPCFAGYYADYAHTHLAAEVHPLIAGHLAAHRAYWAQYLPGAAKWLNAA